jgi:hypothetical protein
LDKSMIVNELTDPSGTVWKTIHYNSLKINLFRNEKQSEYLIM